MSDPSDLPSQVTLDLGFGDTITVDAPSTNEYGIAGITSSLGNAGGGGGVQTRQRTKLLLKSIYNLMQVNKLQVLRQQKLEKLQIH